MLIGGFQNVDMPSLEKPVEGVPVFPLPCDTGGHYTHQVLTNNGRTATIHLLRSCMKLGGDDVLLLPDYLCLSILVSVEEPGVRYRFYHVNRDLSIDLKSLNEQMDDHVKGIYIIHYFGVPSDLKAVEALKELRRNSGAAIIEDITQTLLSRDEQRMGFGDYLVGSTRKWLPMTDGGILAAREGTPLPNFPLADPYNEAAYKQLLITLIREYYDAHPALDMEAYLAWEREANRVRYTDLTVRGMTDFSRSVMFHADLSAAATRRRENYRYLYERLRRIPGVALLSKPMDEQGRYVPFGLVVLTKERDRFYHALAREQIVGEIQWILPTEFYTPGEAAQYLSNHNLMLHCDQRYTIGDMQRVAEAVERFFQI